MKAIFLNALNVKWDKKLNKLVVDEEKMNKMKNKLNIDENQKPIKLKKGSILYNQSDLYYVIGGTRRTQQIEIKSLAYKNEIANKYVKWENVPSGGRWIISLSSIARDFKLCKTDPIGNIYDIKSFEEFFK